RRSPPRPPRAPRAGNGRSPRPGRCRGGSAASRSTLDSGGRGSIRSRRAARGRSSSLEPIEDVAAVRMALGAARMVEILVRVAAHPEALHYPPRRLIGLNGIGDDLGEPEAAEPVVERGA